MNASKFLNRLGLRENPFGAEEARHDAVFDRLDSVDVAHPDFPKVLGQLDHPSSSIVFGEKGSGKTAIRLMMSREIAKHNAGKPGKRLLLVGYDDLNPFLDRLVSRRAGGRAGEEPTGEQIDAALKRIRQEDHQDAILSLAMTRVVDGLLKQNQSEENPAEQVDLTAERIREARQRPRANRLELALLAALYDQPGHGSALERWPKLLRLLRLQSFPVTAAQGVGAVVLGVASIGLAIALNAEAGSTLWLALAIAACAGGAVWLGTLWGMAWWRIRTIAHQVRRECPILARDEKVLRRMLGSLPSADLAEQPWPVRSAKDARFRWTQRMLEWLEWMGYRGLLVLVDRVDEPTLVGGLSRRMRSIVWPLLDNKFLQQPGMGFKLLLPIELRHELRREDPDFFQRARLDKQHMVERLEWSGATLYDLCNARIRACGMGGANRGGGAGEENSGEQSAASGVLSLRSLFAADVQMETLIGALDQMKQPRDAFKFLYAVIQEHCRNLPEEQGDVLIPRATLEVVLRQQAQRLIDLRRGESPA